MTPITRVQSLVCDRYNVTIDDLLGESMSKTVLEARNVAMLLCRIYADPTPSWTELARAFGDRDHASCLRAVRRVKARWEIEPMLRSRIDGIAEKLAKRAARFAGSAAE